MTGAVGRGLLAGAVGTTVLNAVTYLDMAVRGRPASTVPGQVVEVGLARAGLRLAGSGDTYDSRLEGAAAIVGIATGTGVGVLGSLARASGVRLSPVTGSVVTGGLAMAASDGSAALLGVTDPRTWTAADWASDVVPHLAYGVATRAALRRLERGDPSLPRATRPSLGLLGRSFALGTATGMRSALGLAGSAFAAPTTSLSRVARAGSVAAVVGEMFADKLPATPSRLELPGLLPRFGAATAGATALAAREDATADLPALVAALGAGVGAVAGAAWRAAWAEDQRSALASALVEDAAALGLLTVALRH
jgi:hypothetical protein